MKSLQFAFSYGATLGASIFVLPLILNNYPLAAWNAIAVGSSIGTFAAIIIEGGWGFAGPGLHQQIEDELSLKLLQRALRQKLLLLCAVLPIVISVTWYISDKSLPVLSVCVAVAFSTIGFNFTWIF